MPLTTIAFDEGLMAYKVIENSYAMSMDLCCSMLELDARLQLLQLARSENISISSIEIRPETIIETHIVGENPLISN